MVTFAEAGDPWGISNPDFLLVYLWLIAVGFGLAMAAIRVVVSLVRAPDELLHPYVLAYTNGGSSTALLAAVTRMRIAGILAPRQKVLLCLRAPLPADAHPVDAAIVGRIGNTGQCRKLSTLYQDGGLRSTLSRVRDEARELRLVLSPKRRVVVITVAFGFPGLTVLLGIRRLMEEGANGGEPSAWLLAEIALAVVVMVAAGIVGVCRRRTYVGAALSRTLRRENRHLSARAAPSFETYGPELAAVSVGLFGAEVLTTADPALAATIDRRFKRLAAGARGDGGIGGGAGGGGCGGAGGCGGGGGGCGGGGGGGGG